MADGKPTALLSWIVIDAHCLHPEESSPDSPLPQLAPIWGPQWLTQVHGSDPRGARASGPQVILRAGLLRLSIYSHD